MIVSSATTTINHQASVIAGDPDSINVAIADYSIPTLNPRLSPEEARKEILIPRITSDSEVFERSLELVKIIKAKHSERKLPAKISLSNFEKLVFPEIKKDLDQELFTITAYNSVHSGNAFLIELPWGLIDERSDSPRARTLMKMFYGHHNNLKTAYDIEIFSGWQKELDKFGLTHLQIKYRLLELLKKSLPGWLDGRNPIIRPWKAGNGIAWHSTNKLEMLKDLSHFVFGVKHSFIDSEGRFQVTKFEEEVHDPGKYLRDESPRYIENAEIKNTYQGMLFSFPDAFGWGDGKINPAHSMFQIKGKWKGEEGRRLFRRGVMKSLYEAGLGRKIKSKEDNKIIYEPSPLPGGFVIKCTLPEFIYWRDKYFANIRWLDHIKRNKLEGGFKAVLNSDTDALIELLRLEGSDSNKITGIPFNEFSASKARMNSFVQPLMTEITNYTDINDLTLETPKDDQLKKFFSKIKLLLNPSEIENKAVLDKAISLLKRDETVLETLAKAKESQFSSKDLKTLLKFISAIIQTSSKINEDLRTQIAPILEKLTSRRCDIKATLTNGIDRTEKTTLLYGGHSTNLRQINCFTQALFNSVLRIISPHSLLITPDKETTNQSIKSGGVLDSKSIHPQKLPLCKPVRTPEIILAHHIVQPFQGDRPVLHNQIYFKDKINSFTKHELNGTILERLIKTRDPLGESILKMHDYLFKLPSKLEMTNQLSTLIALVNFKTKENIYFFSDEDLKNVISVVVKSADEFNFNTNGCFKEEFIDTLEEILKASCGPRTILQSAIHEASIKEIDYSLMGNNSTLFMLDNILDFISQSIFYYKTQDLRAQIKLDRLHGIEQPEITEDIDDEILLEEGSV